MQNSTVLAEGWKICGAWARVPTADYREGKSDTGSDASDPKSVEILRR